MRRSGRRRRRGAVCPADPIRRRSTGGVDAAASSEGPGPAHRRPGRGQARDRGRLPAGGPWRRRLGRRGWRFRQQGQWRPLDDDLRDLCVPVGRLPVGEDDGSADEQGDAGTEQQPDCPDGPHPPHAALPLSSRTAGARTARRIPRYADHFRDGTLCPDGRNATAIAVTSVRLVAEESRFWAFRRVLGVPDQRREPSPGSWGS